MKNKYKINGETTIIYCNYKNNIIETIIDTKSLEIAMKLEGTWYANFHKDINNYYIMCNCYIDGKRTAILLHRLITGIKNISQIDHFDRNTLNNRTNNLKIVNNSENQQNCGIQKNNTSGVRGVSWNKTNKMWVAVVQLNNKQVFKKYFKNIKDAEIAIIKARKKYHNYVEG